MWTPCKTKKERQQRIKDLLAVNDKAVERAVVAIYKLQTEAEKAIEATTDANNVGYSAFDAEIMSSFASRLLKGWPLTEKQMVIARKKISHYSRQLAEIAEGREKAYTTPQQEVQALSQPVKELA